MNGTHRTRVCAFADGDRHQTSLLGGKGANLAEMVHLGLPVPPGFTVTTEACREYLAGGKLGAGLMDDVRAHLRDLERTLGKRLGDPDDPLLVSVRSGAAVSMPGMMETVLNLGLNHRSVAGLARQTGDQAFAWDTFGRFLRMYAEVVLGVTPSSLAGLTDRTRGQDADDGSHPRQVVTELQERIRSLTGTVVPEDPFEQLEAAIAAVFESWNCSRATRYRQHHGIDDALGTAATVQAMVFGNLGPTSGTGVAFTRDPSTGEPVPFGDVLPDAQGEDVVAGTRPTRPIAELDAWLPDCGAQLTEMMSRLEQHYRDMCDIEFTIERGRLWLLQTRVGKRTARAAVRIAVDMVDEAMIDQAEAVRRVPTGMLDRALHTHFPLDGRYQVLTEGLPASPGAASGRVCLDPDEAEELADDGETVILVRQETSPHDLHGMLAAEGILTCAGGLASHAAVVARDLGTPAVVGAADVRIDHDRRCLVIGDTTVEEGDVISIDGASGQVVLGPVEIEQPVHEGPALRLMTWHREHAGRDRAAPARSPA